MRARYLLCVMLLFAVGCQKPGMNDFVAVCQDHETISTATCSSLIGTIQQYTQLNPTITEKEKADLVALVNRLEIIARQSSVINKYVHLTEVDKTMLQELLKSRWTQK